MRLSVAVTNCLAQTLAYEWKTEERGQHAPVKHTGEERHQANQRKHYTGDTLDYLKPNQH
jgi:hypothetical protein